MATESISSEEWEVRLGGQFKALRLALDLDQVTLAQRANVGLGAVKSLESGKGSTLRTIVRVSRVLGRADWLEDFYPEPEISPLALARAEVGIKAPQRASRRSK